MLHVTSVVSVSGLGGHNLLVQVAKSLYGSLSTMTGMFGLTPVQVLLLATALTGALIAFSVVQRIRGREGFTLEPQEGQPR